MQLAEQEARKRGCRGIFLDTMEGQAPGFYRKLGYVEYGRIDNFLPGQNRFFFQKRDL
jgi:ribosomal protein S18 acetylase RimI-like enzyme